MSIGTTYIKFSDLKTKYQSKSGVISGTEIRLSDFRGALFTNKTYIADNHQTYSIGSLFKGKTFSDKPYLYYHSSSGSWDVNDSDSLMHILTSNNHSHNSTSSYKLKAIGNGSIRLKMSGSSEIFYDYGYLFVNGVQKINNSGSYSGSFTNYTIKANQIVEFKYTKDGSVSDGNDNAVFFVDYYGYYGNQGGFPTTLSVKP